MYADLTWACGKNAACPLTRRLCGFLSIEFCFNTLMRSVVVYLCASLFPNDSAIIAVTRAFMLTPSCFARAASLACKLFGIRWTKRPLAWLLPGSGTGSLNSCEVSIHEFIASIPFFIASSIVSPSSIRRTNFIVDFLCQDMSY